jgi:hypothetical protein
MAARIADPVGHSAACLRMSARFSVRSSASSHRERHVTAIYMTKHMSGTLRYPCAVCGDPWTLDAPDYVELTVRSPDGGTQWLGAHTGCLKRFFDIKVEVGTD